MELKKIFKLMIVILMFTNVRCSEEGATSPVDPKDYEVPEADWSSPESFEEYIEPLPVEEREFREEYRTSLAIITSQAEKVIASRNDYGDADQQASVLMEDLTTSIQMYKESLEEAFLEIQQTGKLSRKTFKSTLDKHEAAVRYNFGKSFNVSWPSSVGYQSLLMSISAFNLDLLTKCIGVEKAGEVSLFRQEVCAEVKPLWKSLRAAADLPSDQDATEFKEIMGDGEVSSFDSPEFYQDLVALSKSYKYVDLNTLTPSPKDVALVANVILEIKPVAKELESILKTRNYENFKLQREKQSKTTEQEMNVLFRYVHDFLPLVSRIEKSKSDIELLGFKKEVNKLFLQKHAEIMSILKSVLERPRDYDFINDKVGALKEIRSELSAYKVFYLRDLGKRVGKAENSLLGIVKIGEGQNE